MKVENNSNNKPQLSKLTVCLAIFLFLFVGIPFSMFGLENFQNELSIGNFLMLVIFGILPIWTAFLCLITLIFYDGKFETFQYTRMGAFTAIVNLVFVGFICLAVGVFIDIFYKNSFLNLLNASGFEWRDILATIFFGAFVLLAYHLLRFSVNFNMQMLKEFVKQRKK